MVNNIRNTFDPSLGTPPQTILSNYQSDFESATGNDRGRFKLSLFKKHLADKQNHFNHVKLCNKY